MGPDCPLCDWIYEWTDCELNEEVHFPQTFFCQDCGHIFTLEVEEIQAIKDKLSDYFNSCTPAETEEDWSKIRSAWDNGELR